MNEKEEYETIKKMLEAVYSLSADISDLAREFHPSILDPSKAAENRIHWALGKMAYDVREAARACENDLDAFYAGGDVA